MDSPESLDSLTEAIATSFTQPGGARSEACPRAELTVVYMPSAEARTKPPRNPLKGGGGETGAPQQGVVSLDGPGAEGTITIVKHPSTFFVCNFSNHRNSSSKKI